MFAVSCDVLRCVVLCYDVMCDVMWQAGSDFMFYSGGVYSQSQYAESFLDITNVCGFVTICLAVSSTLIHEHKTNRQEMSRRQS